MLLGLMEQLGSRALLDAHVRPHGAWQGNSLGTLATLWLTHILCACTHTLSTLRAWVAARPTSFNPLLHLTLLHRQLGDPPFRRRWTRR